MQLSKTCPICLTHEVQVVDPGIRPPLVREVCCPNCGPFSYRIAQESGLLFEGEHQDPSLGLGPKGSRKRANAAGYLYWHPGLKIAEPTDVRRLSVLESPSLRERLDTLLKCIQKETVNLGEHVIVDLLAWQGRSWSTTIGEILDLLSQLETERMIWLSKEKGSASRQVRILPAGRLYLEDHGMKSSDTSRSSPIPESTGVVFISHSEADRDLTKALVDYLLASLALEDRQVLCTSVPGHQLGFGAPVIAQIRQKLVSSRAVLILLTQRSIGSPWVMFEAGAAWALGVHTIPIIGPDVDLRDVPDFFSQIPAILLAKNEAGPRLLDAIMEIAEAMRVDHRPGGRAQAALDAFLSQVRSTDRQHSPSRAVNARREKVYKGWYRNGTPHVTVDDVPLAPDYGSLRRHGYPADPDEEDDAVYAWGYAGTGPQQLAFMIVQDCLKDDTKARDFAADFADQVLSHLSRENHWVLSEREVDFEIKRMEDLRKRKA